MTHASVRLIKEAGL